MREIKNLNFKWYFQKNGGVPKTVPSDWTIINIPYTYNAIDGQDGNNDYYRGKASFVKEIYKNELPTSDKYYLEINGANSSSDVYINNNLVKHHDGGYSTFRVDITDYIETKNIISIITDNAANDFCYPQSADFTFYGGIYRDVNIICVPSSHFDLDYYGNHGLKVTPKLVENKWFIETETFISNPSANQKIITTITKPCGCKVDETINDVNNTISTIEIKQPHLWNGRIDPYLYTVTCKLVEDDKVLDEVTCKTGLRTFRIDPNDGFILNDKEYPLRGVSRHQDRWALGNALTKKEHKQDIELILEGGFTTIRLAHYQHDQYFYDLCDEAGLIIWAEIPYITNHMVKGRENTINQMKELLVQNYNHPCIVVWGLSNEINAGQYSKEVHEDLLENHKILNELCHEYDPTRLTTMAIVSNCPLDDPYITIPDSVSWNHYFGWYQGNVSEYGPWFDKFHKLYPDLPVGCSEYGCEAPLNWHTSTPEPGDYTEEYQRYYHEECIKQLYTRKYIWATHVWNMFDFAADARNEGGEPGQNHKGLVDFKREYKKDSFYAYKAWLSKEPFVHICGKRYIDHTEDEVEITVYSNEEEVELLANEISLGKKKAEDHFFRFIVKNEGKTNLKAITTNCEDSAFINKVNEPNKNYVLTDKTAVLNWWDITEVEGHLSLNSKLEDVANSDSKDILEELLGDHLRQVGWPLDILCISTGNFNLMRLISMLGVKGLTKEKLLEVNAKLNQRVKK